SLRMLMRSGGELSVAATVGPMLSRSLLVAHRSPVVGLNARPTEFRRPLANTCPPLPSRLYRTTAARRGSLSRQMLQEEPIDRYSRLSGPNARVRVAWPPVG